jgi:glycosyltransferase involved in cell wall biosynthesis
MYVAPQSVSGRVVNTVIFSSVQRRFAIDHGLIAPERLFNLHFMVDDRFYSPRPGADDVIASVGAEMRDYATLFEALDGTDLRCEVAAGTVRIPHRVRLIKDRRVPVMDLLRRPNPNVSIGYRGSLVALRDLYAQSRFVVVPLLPTKSDNGLTVMLEAMAMGKAVVCSRTEGQVDAIDEGRTGLFTPVGDAASLRRTMVDLWHDPARAAAMGAAARAQVERHHSLEQFCANFVSAFEASMAGDAAPAGWWEASSLIPERDLPGRLSGERPERPAVSTTPTAVAHSTP